MKNAFPWTLIRNAHRYPFGRATDKHNGQPTDNHPMIRYFLDLIFSGLIK